MTGILAVIAALCGTPLFIVISAIALIAFQRAAIDPMAVVIEMARLADTPMLASLPLFIFAGMLLAESNTPARLLALTRALAGRLPGGLAVVSIALCSLFTALTGATGVTIFALGGLLYPALLQDRYSENFSLGLLTSAGSLGLLLPPSLPLILFGVISGARIDQLFLAGLVPGLFMVLVLAAYGIWRAPEVRTSGTGGSLAKALRQAAWELPLPVIVFGGIYGGYLVVGEAAAVTALYALVVEVFIYRDIAVGRLPEVIVKSLTLFGGIMVVLAASLATTSYLVDQQVPELIFGFLEQYISSRFAFLIGLNLFLLLVGAILDIFSAIVLVVPIIVPVAQRYGIDLVHLGIIFLTNLQIGYCTPPVGLNLFLASYQFDKPILKTCRATLPFTLLLLLVLLVVTYLPELSLFLVGD